jgi:hypothetical protein
MPWWIPIEKNLLDSTINHEKSIALTLHHWHIYTDGSGINGHVGASATCQILKQAYLGPDKEFTVPITELAGLALALDIAKEAADRQIYLCCTQYPENSSLDRTKDKDSPEDTNLKGPSTKHQGRLLD